MIVPEIEQEGKSIMVAEKTFNFIYKMKGFRLADTAKTGDEKTVRVNEADILEEKPKKSKKRKC